MTSLLFLAFSLVIYLSLATLPKGRPAAIGLAAALLLLTALRLAIPSVQGAAYVALISVAMAAVAQGLRTALGPRLPHGLYLGLLGVLPMLAILFLSVTVGD